MRLRNIRGSKEAIGASRWVVREPETRKGSWAGVFGNGRPIAVEVGMGKGRFLMDMAAAHPDMNFIGIEMYDSVLLRAVQRADGLLEPPQNFRFIRMDARQLAEVFARGEIARIYLNFSDPWPKERHAKRRLTSRQFLERYEQILLPGSRVEFKTDNRELFEFSLEELRESGWVLDECTRDLHRDAQMSRGNIMTEYEEKFSSQGNPIYKLTAHFEERRGSGSE